MVALVIRVSSPNQTDVDRSAGCARAFLKYGFVRFQTEKWSGVGHTSNCCVGKAGQGHHRQMKIGQLGFVRGSGLIGVGVPGVNSLNHRTKLKQCCEFRLDGDLCPSTALVDYP